MHFKNFKIKNKLFFYPMKFKSISVLFLLLYTLHVAPTSNAQEHISPYSIEPVPHGSPTWFYSIAKDPYGVNFYEMEKKYQRWRKTDTDFRIKTPYNKAVINFYTRWQRAVAPYVAPESGKIVLPSLSDYGEKVAKIQQKLDHNQRRLSAQRVAKETVSEWTNIGPNRTLNKEKKNGKRYTFDWQTNVHRIAVAKTDDNILFCGTESGAIFKTTDGGKNWFAPAPLYFFGRYIFAIHIDPTDKNTIYVGSETMLSKSTDGGNTWRRLNGIDYHVNSIRVNPANNQHITVATERGFFVSKNGGTTFTNTLTRENTCHDHELKPNDPNTIYLLASSSFNSHKKFYTSTDGGNTFDGGKEIIPQLAAGRLAVTNAPGGENYLYALLTTSHVATLGAPYGGKGVPHIMKSTDGGNTWIDQTNDNTFSDYGDKAYGGNGYFDMMVGASDTNKEHVVFGLTGCYRSTQGGAGVNANGGHNGGYIGGYGSNDNMHPDIQDVAISGDKIWIATDGGVKYSDDFFATSGEFRFQGIYASEFWKFGMGWNKDIMVGGRYHNGDAALSEDFGSGNSIYVGGTEKATGYVLLSDPHKVVFSDINAQILPQTIDGEFDWLSFTRFPDESHGSNKKGSIATDPRYAKRLIIIPSYFHGWTATGENIYLYESLDEGVSFTRMNYVGAPQYVAFARSNPDIIYVADRNLMKSVDNGKTFVQTATRPSWFYGSELHHVSIDPHDANKIWVTQNADEAHVAYSTDGGNTWTNPIGGSSVVKGHLQEVYLVGDEKEGVYLASYKSARIFYKDNTMTDWVAYGEGLPQAASPIHAIPFYKEGKMRVGSRQGIWEKPLYRPQFRPTAQPMITNLGTATLPNPDMKVQFESYSIVNQEGAKWEWSFSPAPEWISSATVRNPTVIFTHKGEYDVTLKVTNSNGQSHTRTIHKMVNNPTEGNYTDPTTDVLNPRLENAYKVTVSPSIVEKGNMIRFSFKELIAPKQLTIFNAKGQEIDAIQIEKDSKDYQLQTHQMEQGVYLFLLQTETYKRYGKFIVK